MQFLHKLPPFLFHPPTPTLESDHGVPQGTDNGYRVLPPPQPSVHLPPAADLSSCWRSMAEVNSSMSWDSCLGWHVFPWAAGKRKDRLYLQLLQRSRFSPAEGKCRSSTAPCLYVCHSRDSIRAAIQFLHIALLPVLLAMDRSYQETQ